MHFRRIFASAAAVVFAAFVAAGCGNSIPSNSICAVYGQGIKKSDYTKILGQAKRNYTSQGQKFPKTGSDEYKTLTKQAIDYLITQKLYEREAKSAGITVSKKDIDKRLKQLKTSFFHGDEKAYQKELKKQHLTEGAVRDNLRMQLLNEKLFKHATREVKVSDSKAEQYFKENPSQYQTAESRDVAHILVKDKKTADKLYAQIVKGDKPDHKLFAELAKKNSKDPSSATQGGTLTITKGQTVPEFDKESFALKTGETSKPVKTQFGYHIIQARGDVKAAKKQSFKDVSAQIKQQLSQEEKTKRMQDWQDTVRKRAAQNKHVNCKKGYVWTQTVKSTASTPPAGPTPTPAPNNGNSKGDTGATATVGKNGGKASAGGKTVTATVKK